MIAGGDLRSIGRANEVVALVMREPKRMKEVVNCLSDADACIRMRAADVLEKVSREQAKVVQPFRTRLLGLLAEATQKEVRWHLALTIPRLRLSPPECRFVADSLKSYLEDHSSIVKTFALQGLSDLTAQCEDLKPAVSDLIQLCIQTGSPAMRARGRILLRNMESEF